MNEVVPKTFSSNHLKQVGLQNRKAAIANAIPVILFSIVVGIGSISAAGAGIYSWLAKIVQIALFLGAGWLHISIMDKRRFFLTRNSYQQWFYFLSLSVGLFFVLCILYLITNGYLVLMALASSCAFFLPFGIAQTWEGYNNIPFPQHKLWYNTENNADKLATIFLNSLSVQVSISSKLAKPGNDVFTVVVPGRMKLGTAFYHLLQEQNNCIDQVDEKQTPFAWELYTEVFGGLKKRRFDPDASLIENKIKANTIIFVKRVRTSMEGRFLS